MEEGWGQQGGGVRLEDFSLVFYFDIFWKATTPKPLVNFTLNPSGILQTYGNVSAGGKKNLLVKGKTLDLSAANTTPHSMEKAKDDGLVQMLRGSERN